MSDPVLQLAKEFYEKGVESEMSNDFESAKYYYAQAAIKFYQSATYSKGPAYEVRIRKAEECRERINRLKIMEDGLGRGVKGGGGSEMGSNKGEVFKASLEKQSLRFSDVVGLEEVKERIRIAMLYPRTHKGLYRKFGLRAGGRILMYGPPGCGKTFIAKSSAGELGLPLIQAKISEIMSKWVGNAEKNITNLFKYAKENAGENGGTVLFLDEIDALGASRELVSSSTVARRVVTQLLLEISNLPEGVLLIAATNSPWALDPALVRTGRLGTPVFVPPPDKETRKTLFKKALEGRPVGVIDIERLVDLTEGFSVSDIVDVGGLCEQAASRALKEAIATGRERKIEMKDFIEVLESGSLKPSVTPWVIEAQRKLTRNPRLARIFPELMDFVRSYMRKNYL